ncbi:MAG TPA: DNA polymerase [Acidimicrobiia bacterium]|nr:DNA polymerase [Acidimicrobiia bacterium]
MAEPGLLDELRALGIERGDLVALAVAPGVGYACATETASAARAGEAADDVARIEAELRPRWVMWSNGTARVLVEAGVRVATAWDLAAVHRILRGGWNAEPDRIWVDAHRLAPDGIPTDRPPDLFSELDTDAGDPEEPVRRDGYLRADWARGEWAVSLARVARWAQLAARLAEHQQRDLATIDRPAAASLARSESAAELLCAELSVDGLPVDLAVAQELIAGAVGPRPRSEADAQRTRDARDAAVLRHLPAGAAFDLRSPGQVKSMLGAVGIEVPDTRAARLESVRAAHPVVDALLTWRKGERIATTYGYAWLDENVHDGRLRGAWTGCDGAAGRMTASAGLHNLPADMRAAVVAEAGHVFVRADLGQIEPRVLAAVSGDAALARATQADDLYAPVAAALDVDRATAKVAVLGAMYGQTTGHGARALRRLDDAYPVAMAYLQEADRAAQAAQALRTYGGRLIPMGSLAADAELDPHDARARVSARGRYGRNAMVQGAAAELFKAWAATVRARGAELDARIVLCLHDELLVHVPATNGADAAQLVTDCLQEAASRWAPDGSVRFIAEVSVIARWSDAKG